MPKNSAQIEKNRQAKIMRQKARAKARKPEPQSSALTDVMEDLAPDRRQAVLSEARRVVKTM